MLQARRLTPPPGPEAPTPQDLGALAPDPLSDCPVEDFRARAVPGLNRNELRRRRWEVDEAAEVLGLSIQSGMLPERLGRAV